jgi:hypothetical protein
VKRDVYVIQIVAYDSREASKEAGLEQHFEDDDAAISVENIDGIHLIQIELRRIGMSFPVAAEVALGWTKLEWWCYLLKFSGQFSEEEIKRCRGLGIPDGVISGLAQLRRRFWSQRQRTRYLPEVNAIGPTFEALVRSPPERGNP